MTVLKNNLCVLVAAGIVSFQLFVPPSVGLANNGDFGKIIGIFNVAAPVRDENGYAAVEYGFHSENHFASGFHSSETLLAAAAIALNSVLTKTGTFDLRWIGLIHAALFLVGLHLLQPLLMGLSNLRRFVISASILLTLCDVMYVSWMNSFYMDTATYLFLLLALVLFLRAVKFRRKSDAIWFIACSTAMILSKTQHAIVGVWVAGLCAVCCRQMWPNGGSRRFAVVAVLATLSATVAGIWSAPREYPARGYFSVIFYQILPHSNDPVGDLYALGLDASYSKWSGMHAYSEGARLDNVQFLKTFSAKTSYRRLAWFLLTHPRSTYLALNASLAQGGRQRPILGNFDRGAGLAAFSESQAFSIWSGAKRRLFDEHGARYLCCWVSVLTLVCALGWTRRAYMTRAHLLGCFALAGMALSAMLIASLADAVDVPRHHFIANTLLDILILLCSVFCVWPWSSPSEHRAGTPDRVRLAPTPR